MERFAHLSLEELKKLLENPHESDIPECGILNLIGRIATNNRDQSVAAQEELVKLLTDGNTRGKWTSIRCLCDVVAAGLATPVTIAAIDAFKANPDNKDLIPTVKLNAA